MGRGTGAKQKRSRRGFYAKSGVVFPVRRIHRYLKEHHLVNHKARVSTTGALYLAAVMEYLTAEVLELSGIAAHDHKKKRINPKAIWLAIKSDYEFSQLLKGSIMPECGNLWGEGLRERPTDSIPPGGASSSFLTATKRTIKTKQMPTPVTSTFPMTTTLASRNDDPSPGSVETLSERTLLSGVQLSVLKADITSVEANCYVNPSSSSVSFVGQVGGRLAAVGGKVLQDVIGEFRNQIIPPNGTVTTPAAGLLANHIIHCNSPSWGDTNAIQKLEETVINCLEEVSRFNFKSIAMPSIGSGGNQFPKHTAAQTILRTISSFYKNKPAAKFQPERIVFVLYDKQSVSVFRTELARLIE